MIIYNLSQLKISINDSKNIEIETYIDLLEIQSSILGNNPNEPSQVEIDLLFS